MKIEEFKVRRLRERYISCYILKKEIDMEIDGIIQEVNCIVVYGITLENRRQWVGIYIEKEGDINFWYEMLQSMKKRGLKSVGIFVIDKGTAVIAKNRAQLKAWIKNMATKVNVKENTIWVLEQIQ